MKTLVAYSSKTGNTKKIAEAINSVVNGDLVDIADGPNVEDYDNIIVGYWADKGIANKEGDEFLDKIKGKNCGVFATLGAYPDSDHALDIINYGVEKLKSQNNRVFNTFICQGMIDPKLTEMMKAQKAGSYHQWTEERAKLHEDAAKHPNDEDIANAKTAFIDFLEKVEAIG